MTEQIAMILAETSAGLPASALSFDIMTRGLHALLSGGEASREKLGDIVWQLEQIITQACLPLLREAIALDERYRAGAAEELPDYCYLIDNCRTLLGASRIALANATDGRVASQFTVAGVEELRNLILQVEEIVDDEDFPVVAANLDA